MNRDIKPAPFRASSYVTKNKFLNGRRKEKWGKCNTCEPFVPRAQTGGFKFVSDRQGRPANTTEMLLLNEHHFLTGVTIYQQNHVANTSVNMISKGNI